jgi:hypothetical protein
MATGYWLLATGYATGYATSYWLLATYFPQAYLYGVLFCPEDGSSKCLRNMTELQSNYMKSFFGTQKSSKNTVLWDGTPCGSGKNRRLGGTYRLHHRGNFFAA